MTSHLLLYHDGNGAGKLVVGNQPQEPGHRLDSIQQRVVKVDVDDRGTVLDLFPCHLDRHFVIPVAYQAGKLATTRNIGSLADHGERDFGPHDHRQLPGQPRVDLARCILLGT